MTGLGRWAADGEPHDSGLVAAFTRRPRREPSGHGASAGPASVLAELARMPEELAAALASLPPEASSWSPASWEECPAERFSALEHVCHLRDIERDGYQVRLRRTAREPRPFLASLDGYALARERRYAEQRVPDALAAFAEARRATLHEVEGWSPDVLDRTSVFADFGIVTAAGLLQLLRSHDLQHLAGLRWLGARWHAEASRS